MQWFNDFAEKYRLLNIALTTNPNAHQLQNCCNNEVPSRWYVLELITMSVRVIIQARAIPRQPESRAG